MQDPQTESAIDPTAEAVWPPPPSNSPILSEPSSEEAILEFRRRSALLVFFLTIVTLGLYNGIWLHQVSARLRRLLPEEPVPLFYDWTVLIALIVSVVASLISIVAENAQIDQDSHLLWNVVGILMLVFTFQVRNRLNRVVRAVRGEDHWFIGVYTFLFSAAYLQHKINREITFREQERLAKIAAG